MAGLQQPSIHFVTIKVQLLLLFVLDSTSLVDIPALHGVSDISSLIFSLFFLSKAQIKSGPKTISQINVLTNKIQKSIQD